MIPASHPRFESLRIREMLVGGFNAGAVAIEGIIAHGRGEAFDYLMGEVTTPCAQRAAYAAAAALLLAKNPVISINGNVAALCPKEAADLAKVSDSALEVNLFYDSDERRRIIRGILLRNGAGTILGVDEERDTMRGLESERRRISSTGIAAADVVLVPLEDGDRTEALRDLGKKVIAIDLNPLSRTAHAASITIVDNVMRALPMLTHYCSEMSEYEPSVLGTIAGQFDNMANIKDCMLHIKKRLGGMDDA